MINARRLNKQKKSQFKPKYEANQHKKHIKISTMPKCIPKEFNEKKASSNRDTIISNKKDLKTLYFSTSQTTASSFKPTTIKEEINNDKMVFMPMIKANLFNYNLSSGNTLINNSDEIESYAVFKENIDKQRASKCRYNNNSNRFLDSISDISKEEDCNDYEFISNDDYYYDDFQGEEDNVINKDFALISLKTNCNNNDDTVVNETTEMENHLNKTIINSNNIKSCLMCPYKLISM